MDIDEQLLPDPEVDDIALDFVEQRLGRYFFVQNWRRLKKAGNPVESIRKWMTLTRQDASKAPAVAHQVDCLARADSRWTS